MNTRVHISFTVADLDKSIAFYREFFAHDATKKRDDYANFRLDTPAIHLALVHKDALPEQTVSRAASHFGVEVENHEQLNAWRERLKESGVEFRDDLNTSCCYASADKFWVRDPDNHEWEVWVRTGEADQLMSDDKQCCAA